MEKEDICAVYSSEFEGRPLGDIPYIGRKTDIAFEREIAQWMRENGVVPKSNGIYVDSITACVEMVTGGWAILPEVCLDGFTGVVRPLRFEDGTAFVRSTYVIYSDAALLLPTGAKRGTPLPCIHLREGVVHCRGVPLLAPVMPGVSQSGLLFFYTTFHDTADNIALE